MTQPAFAMAAIGQVNTVPEVLGALDQVQVAALRGPLRSNGGVACFNSLYQTITGDVLKGLTGGGASAAPGAGFGAGAAFIERLDVTFARRYLEALNSASSPTGQTPAAWQVLIEQTDNRNIHPIQFAAAGVNAHINLDLPVAVVNACLLLGSDPQSGANHDGYQVINQIFAANMQALRERFETSPLMRWADHLAAPVTNALDDAAVVGSRDVAWQRALELWERRDRPDDRDGYIAMLDRYASLVGSAILLHL